jgi:hypothetical protein
MTRFIVFTPFTRPGLHVWREGTQLKLYLEPLQQPGLPSGFHAFDCELEVAPQEKIYSLLFQWNQNGTDQIEWEQESHIHEVPRLENNRLPPSVWLFHGSARAVAADPLARQQDRVRIHLLTAARYMRAELLVWNASGPAQQTIPLTAHDESGPFWDLDLSGRSRSFFQFKFRRPVEGGWKDEHDFANRLWTFAAGAARSIPMARSGLADAFLGFPGALPVASIALQRPRASRGRTARPARLGNRRCGRIFAPAASEHATADADQ